MVLAINPTATGICCGHELQTRTRRDDGDMSSGPDMQSGRAAVVDSFVGETQAS